MRKTDILFGDNALQQAILIFAYLAGVFFLGISIYAMIGCFIPSIWIW